MILKKVIQYNFRTFTRTDMVFKEHKWRVKHITANAQGAVTPGSWQQEYIIMGDLNSQTANAPTYADIFGGDETTYTSFDRDKYDINNLRLQVRVTKYKKLSEIFLKREKKKYKPDGTLKASQPAINYKKPPNNWGTQNLLSSNSVGDGNIVQITETFENPFGKFLCAIQGDDITECDLGTISNSNYNATASNILSA